jgi:hypothetical protein
MRLLATTVTAQQGIALAFFLLAAFTFLLATFWNGVRTAVTPWAGLIPLGLTLLACGFLTIWWP